MNTPDITEIQSSTKLEQEDYEFDRQAEDVAKERGCVVIFPEPHQLQIDIDSEEAEKEFYRRINLFFMHGEVVSQRRTTSGGGEPHCHITVNLDANKVPLNEWTRICLQAVLGSDIIREYLNAKRLLYGNPKATRLFEVDTPVNEKTGMRIGSWRREANKVRLNLSGNSGYSDSEIEEMISQCHEEKDFHKLIGKKKIHGNED